MHLFKKSNNMNFGVSYVSFGIKIECPSFLVGPLNEDSIDFLRMCFFQPVWDMLIYGLVDVLDAVDGVVHPAERKCMISISITTMFEATDDDHGKPDISTATRCFLLISAMILIWWLPDDDWCRILSQPLLDDGMRLVKCLVGGNPFMPSSHENDLITITRCIDPSIHHRSLNASLDGGFIFLLFTPSWENDPIWLIVGKMIQSDEHIFLIGWIHQLDQNYHLSTTLIWTSNQLVTTLHGQPPAPHPSCGQSGVFAELPWPPCSEEANDMESPFHLKCLLGGW